MSPSKKIMSSIVYMFTISKRFPSSINLHFLGFLPISKTTNLPSRLLQLSPQKMSPSTMQRYPSENNDHYIPIYDTLMIFSYLYLSRFDFIMLIALFYYPNHRSYYRQSKRSDSVIRSMRVCVMICETKQGMIFKFCNIFK